MNGSNRAHWRPVHDELARWRDAGIRARLWLRDDDAVTVTPALEQFMSICGANGITPLIATIPAHTTRELANYLAHGAAEIAVHGWAHANHAPAGSKAQEFPIHRPMAEVLAELGQSVSRVNQIFDGRELPMYVPPWNRIAPEIAARLPEIGFRALSGYGRKSLFAGEPPLMELNTHVDIIDWRGTRGGHNTERLTRDLTDTLAWSRQNGAPPIGILTHHLAHDAQAWHFLTELFEETVSHAGVCWSSASELMQV